MTSPLHRTTDPGTCKGNRRVNKYEAVVMQQLRANFDLWNNWQLTDTGLTGKELAEKSGTALNCITPRFAPLRRQGFIRDSGRRRDKQIVWVLA